MASSRTVLAASAVLSLGAVVAGVWLSTRPSPPAHAPGPGSHEAPEHDATAAAWEPPSDEGYVGSAACAECHAEISAAYQTHPMSQSLGRVDTMSAAAAFARTDTRVAGEQRVLESDVHDGVMRHHELMFDAEGELIYDHAVAMDYEVGSGQRAKAYLHRRGDSLFMSPLNWYRESGGWDLAPGYTPDDPRRFDRRVTEECLSCHSGRVASLGRGLNRFAEPAFHEMSIGCENCHGPGREHVALHLAGRVASPAEDPIVNPARLDHEHRESVCYQCHLQAAVRLPRYGRSDFDFRPGQSVHEVWSYLDGGSGVGEDGRTRAISHVQQMQESRCYLDSAGQQGAGRLGCTSCHDPHRMPTEAEQAGFYRQRCLSCHTEDSCSAPAERRAMQEDSCIACHMPARESSNIAHLTQTDHRILRVPGAQATGDADPDELVLLEGADPPLAGWERDRTLAVGAWLHLSKKGRPKPASLAPMLLRVLEEAPDDPHPLTILGALAMDHQRPDLAREHYRQARDVPAAEEAALDGLLKIHYLSSEWERALDCADRLIELDPGHARAHAMRADTLKGLGRLDEGIAAAERALELNPTLVPVREWLASALRKAGREAEADEQQQILRRMHGARPPAR